MATTFVMTALPVSPLGGASLGTIGSQRRFRDVCTKSGKWFHVPENCFVAAVTTKQSAGKVQRFEGDKSEVAVWSVVRTGREPNREKRIARLAQRLSGIFSGCASSASAAQT
jgi:hypothetical protein